MSATTALATSVNLYSKILSKFPSENLAFCFAYGSGVLKQTNNVDKRNMIDFILAVNDAEKWHEDNMKMNPGHYSFLSLFGSKAVAKVQTNIPSRVYFNSMIPIKSENVIIKYGVIARSDLIGDLLDWNDLYVAGRLHKPVKIAFKTDSEDLLAALQLNLQSAVHASLLLLPENFSENQFYKTVTSLSYIGDFRMKFGEDKNKVENIVSGGLPKFRKLYAPILKLMEDYVEMPAAGDSLIEPGRSCRQDVSPSARHFHLNHLPRTPQRQLVRFWNKGSRNRQDTEDVLRALAFDPDCGEVVQSILSDIVWESSIKQSLKGILTAGIFTSVVYSSKKIKKMLNIRSFSGSKKVNMSLSEEALDKNNEVTTEESPSNPAESDTDFFGPALPPHLLKKNSSESSKEKIIGPSLPDHIRIEDLNADLDKSEKSLAGQEVETLPSENEEKEGSAWSDEDNVGPSTTLMATGEVSGVYKFMKTENTNEKSEAESSMKRETWMMELPEKKRPNFGSLPRHFKTAAQQVAESDDSVWTDTPADKKRKEGRGKKKDHKEILEVKRLEERDKEMEKLARKAAKKLKKQESLLEMHLKKMKKKKKKEAKKRGEEKAPPERRPFDRNVDLQIRRVDENQRRAILNKSQFLNDRFAAGQSKFL